MSFTVRQSNKPEAYTIIELLTVMSIIVILIGLLVPALSKVRQFAKRVNQKNQFHAISVAMELFNAQFDGYPDSDAKDEDNVDYCGALRLCEAMMGQDLLGFHPDSRFRNDGVAFVPGQSIYDQGAGWTAEQWDENLKSRKGPYLQLENANTYKLKHLYGTGNTASLDEERYVLCDVYKRVPLKDDPLDDTDNELSGKVGMPILYYKVDTTKNSHDVTDALNPDNMYDFQDNDVLVKLLLPWALTLEHPMSSNIAGQTSSGFNPRPEIFYENTLNKNIASMNRPYKSDSYILISAGYDGEYGTPDDVFNFED